MPVFAFEDGEVPDAAHCDDGPIAPISPERLHQEILKERLSRLDLADGVGGLGIRGAGSSTPPVRIASQSPARMSALAASASAAADNVPIPPLNVEAVKKRAARRRKKKGGLRAASPAVQMIHGFQTPPCNSGDESSPAGSAMSTPRLLPRDHRSVTSSPAVGPSTPMSGISQLRMQLDSLASGHTTPTNTSPPGPRAYAMQREWSRDGSETGRSEVSDFDDTYEVPLQTDFVSPEANPRAPILGPVEGGLRNNTICRKMTADDFEPLTCLGKGAFGTVLLVKQNATGRLYAQKQFKKASLTVHKRLIEQTKTERSILESVNRHPFVVKLYYAFQDHEKLYLILEYGQGGELFHHLALERMFMPETAAFYMAELVLALDHLHRNIGVIYRDLKPENCLLDSEGHLLLTDFGLSKVAVDGDDRAKSFLGTVEYMAPEVVMGEEYGRAVDWWSLGALGYDMLTGNPPFTGPNNKKIQEKIKACKLTFPFFLGPDAKDLLQKLLQKNPRKRLGYNMPADLEKIKKHRFFKAMDWKLLAKREVEPPIRPVITDPELAENFSTEFTGLAMSPVEGRKMSWGAATMTAGSRGLDGAGPVAHAATGLVAGMQGLGLEDVDGTETLSDAMVVDNGSGFDPANPFGGFSFVASESLLEESIMTG